MRKKILVTGGSGLIGSHLIPILAKDNSIFVITRDNKLTTKKEIEFINIDLNSDWKIDVLPKDINVIIHLAQSENFREFPSKAVEIFNINTVSTLKLADFAKINNVSNFIYASSAGIYGSGNKAFSENQDIIYRKELGFYLATKYTSEIILDCFSEELNIIQLRFFFVYGGGQRRSMLIPRLVDTVRNGQPISLQGENGITLNPVYVSDAVDAILKSISLNGNHKINIAGPKVYTLREIAEIIGKKVNIEPIFKIDKDKEANKLIGEISKMSNLLCVPTVDFSEGIESVI